jgi:hypothetical protein
MRPCSMLLLPRYGVSCLPESLWNSAGMSHASNPRELLPIDNSLYPVKTRLASGRGTHTLWQGFGLTWDETSDETNAYLVAFD